MKLERQPVTADCVCCVCVCELWRFTLQWVPM